MSKLLTSREAAERLSISESWLRQARCLGRPDAPPFIQIGRAVRYREADLEEWIRQRRRTPVAPE